MNLPSCSKSNNEKFPLGGIGTGCVEIDSSGTFTGIRLHNSVNEEFFKRFFLQFVLKISDNEGNCRAFPLKDGKCSFSFPYARITCECTDFPVTINMSAFNPFIPNNLVDSAIPAVYFDIELENHSDTPLYYSCALVSQNIFDICRNKNGISEDAEIKYIKQYDGALREYDLQNVGEILLSSNCENVSFLENFAYETASEKCEFYSLFERESFFDCKSRDDSQGRYSALCAHTKVDAGKSSSVSFVYAWHFPFVFNKWSPNLENCETDAQILKKQHLAKLLHELF